MMIVINIFSKYKCTEKNYNDYNVIAWSDLFLLFSMEKITTSASARPYNNLTIVLINAFDVVEMLFMLGNEILVCV